MFFRKEYIALFSVSHMSFQPPGLILKLERRKCFINKASTFSLWGISSHFLSLVIIGQSCKSYCILLYCEWHFCLFVSILQHLFLLSTSTSISFQKISSFFLCVVLSGCWNQVFAPCYGSGSGRILPLPNLVQLRTCDSQLANQMLSSRALNFEQGMKSQV